MATLVPRISSMTPACRSRRIDQSPRTARRYSTNGSPPAIMNPTLTHCTAAGKFVNEASRVEKPAVASVVIAWAMASNRFMPAIR